MRILNFGLPRTRSSFLIDVLAKAYDLDNLYEPYHNPIINKVIEKNLQGDDRWIDSCRQTLELTNSLKIKDNFVCKLFPDALFNIFKKLDGNNFIFDNTDYHNIEKSYNISMYDKIYVTYRKNYVDLVCSFLHASKHQNFLYSEKNKNLIKFHSPKNTNLNYTKHHLIRLALTFYFFEHYLNELKKLNDVIILEYNEIPEFVNKEFSGIKSELVESQFDYKNKIKNYVQLSEDFVDVQQNLKVTLLS